MATVITTIGEVNRDPSDILIVTSFVETIDEDGGSFANIANRTMLIVNNLGSTDLTLQIIPTYSKVGLDLETLEITCAALEVTFIGPFPTEFNSATNTVAYTVGNPNEVDASDILIGAFKPA